MDIVCNTRCLKAIPTGIQRYTRKILERLPSKDIIQISPAQTLSQGITAHLWEQFLLPAKLKGSLLWSPSNSGPIGVRRQVVTIHDLAMVEHPEWFNKKFTAWYNYMMPALCKKAEHIIAISDFTRQRLLELYRLPESKVSIIYNGADWDLPLTDVTPLQIPFKRYVLSLSSLEPRKNIGLLLNAWRNILPQIPEDVGLIVVGAIGNTKVFKNAGINKVPERVFFTGYVQDAQVTQLYKNALLFVYLSVYEGFGLPPLEAMALGTPVLTGNKTAMPEVVGEGGALIDTDSLSDCENALINLINNQQLRMELSSKGIKQAKKFDWNKTASETWNVLQRFM